MKYYKDALRIAAEEAFRHEVVEPEMTEHVIGEWKDFATKEDWVNARMQEWLDEASLYRNS